MDSISFGESCSLAATRLYLKQSGLDDDAIDDYLEHHGIKGMKWGQRRWQNEDGSLTAAGREHYGVGDGLKKRQDKANSAADFDGDSIPAKIAGPNRREAKKLIKTAHQVNELASAVKKHHEYVDGDNFETTRDDTKAIKSFEKTITKNPQIKKARKEAVAYMKHIDEIYKQLDKAREAYESNEELTSKFGSWSNYIYNANTPESNKFKQQSMEVHGSRNALRDKLESFLHVFTGEVGSQKLGDMHRVGDVTVDQYLAEFVIDKYIDR